MTPAAHVRVVLAHHRKLDTEFEEAWISSLRSLPKGTCDNSRTYLKEWKVALRGTKKAFRAAYHREEFSGGEAALVLLRGMDTPEQLEQAA